MAYTVGEVIASREQIREAVKGIAAKIDQDFAGKEVLLVGVLKGAMIFLSDLCRELTVPVIIDFIVVSSYGVSTETSGVVLLRKDIDTDIAGKNVIVVEDLIDTGVTLNYLRQLFLTRNPASLKLCTIFDKPGRRKADLTPDYAGIQFDDHFLVGYGLDYANMYRNLPDVRILNRL